MKNIYLFLTCCLLATNIALSQSVGINNPTPDPSAALDITSTEKGILIPRMSLLQRDAIINPAQGLMVFITNDTSFYYYDGNLWLPLRTTIVGGGGGGDYIPGTGITINGNIINNASPDQIISLTGTGSTVVTGAYPNFEINGTDEVEDGDSDPNNELQTISLQDNRLILDRNGGEIVLPEGRGYQGGDGIDIDNDIINNIGDIDPTDDITVNTQAEGDVEGNFPNLSVTALRGRGISNNVPQDGQILKWNGTEWEPANDNAGDANYDAGDGIEINGTTISNSLPDQEVSLTGSGSVNIQGTYPDFTIEVLDQDDDPNNELQTISLQDNRLILDRNGGEIVLPEGRGYQGGDGIDIDNDVINNIGDIDPTDDITVNTQAEGDVEGNFPNLSVTALRGRGISNNVPQDGQILKWNGTEWEPANDNAGDANYDAGDGIEINGTTISNSLPDQEVSLTGSGSVNIQGTYPDFTIEVLDQDDDPNNELQTLTVVGDTALTLSGSDTVDLPIRSLWKENGSKIFYDEDFVGIGIEDPFTNLHIKDQANVLFGDSLSGEGFKMIWYGRKGALRFGYLNQPFGGINYDKFWDYDSVGFYSFAGGQNSRAKGFGAFAWGSFGWADGSGSVAFFGNARGNNSFTFGGSSRGRGSITFEGTAEEEGGIAMYGYTGGRYGVSIGGGTTGLGASSSREDYAVAIGWNADARGQASVSLGPNDAYGYNSFSTGWVTEARGNYSYTMGYRTLAKSYGALALGRYNLDEGDSANWVATDPVLTIGNGFRTGNNQSITITRRNIFTILKNGQTAIGFNMPTGMLQVKTLGSINVGGNLDPRNATLLLGDTNEGMAFDANQIETIGQTLNLNFNSPEDIRMVFGGGNVGIGDNPDARLDVFQSDNDDGGGIRMRDQNNDNNFWDIFLDANDDLQFSRNQVPRASIDVATGAYNQLSDLRMKKNILAPNPVLSQVMQLRPVNYLYKNEPNDASYSWGFIAQEVEEVFPELVNHSEHFLSLPYDEFSVLAIKAIQEQQEEIEEIKRENTMLKDQMAILQAKMDMILKTLENK